MMIMIMIMIIIIIIIIITSIITLADLQEVGVDDERVAGLEELIIIIVVVIITSIITLADLQEVGVDGEGVAGLEELAPLGPALLHPLGHVPPPRKLLVHDLNNKNNNKT